MAEAVVTGLVCVSDHCQEGAVTFCNTCKQSFCATHDQAHSEYLKILKATHDVVTVEEYRRAEREENSRYCTQHQKSPISIACQQCYRPMCTKCIDDSRLMKQCSSTGKKQHETHSLEKVSQKIKDEMSDYLSKLRIKQIKITNSMKARRQLYDAQMEEHRDDLEKLAAKVKELHELIDKCHREWKSTLVSHMTRKKEMMNVLEAEFNEYQKNCEEIHNRSDQYKKQSDLLIVKDRCDTKPNLQPLMGFQLTDNADLFITLSLKLTGDAVKFPISFQTVRPKQPLFDTPSTVEIPSTITIPTNFEFKQEIKTPDNSYCVHYSRSGRLLHSGRYQLSGLDFTPNLPSSVYHYNESLFEHKSSLYMLQQLNNNYHVHVLNLDNRSVSQSIITFPLSLYWDIVSSPSYLQHMSVTDKHILITHHFADTIKIYSTTTYNHMFDIKDTSIFKIPVGLAVLGDTLVVGDFSNNKVVNIPISKTPEIRWSTTGINEPSSIEVKEDSQIILVGSFNKQIHILTLQGEKLSTLDLPQCSCIFDISTYQNQLAVSEGDYKKIRVYEMKYD